MDFQYTEEQQLIREQVRKLADGFDLDYWLERDKTKTYPHDFYQAFADAGWLGIAIPEEYGGAGLGMTEACILLHEICASGAGTSGSSPIHFSIFPPMPIIKYGTDDQKQKYLPSIANGETKLGFSITEPDAGTDTTHITTRAERDGDDYVITGRKVWSSNLQNASRTLLLARTTSYEEVDKKTLGMSLFLLDLKSPGIEIREIDKLGRHSVDSNELFLDEVRVPATDLVGEEGQGFYHLISGLNTERLLVAAEAIGIGRAALDLAVRYANERVVFNRPIGMNQGIQFPLAKAYSQLATAQLMVEKGAWLYDNEHPCGAEANIAKHEAAIAGFDACDAAIQTHGGMGYAREFHVERLWREVRLYKLAPVSQEMALNFIGEHVLGLPKSY
ncbi:MAG: acyl-CoA dehydrogenase family protein [Candidatus Hydrogenedentota bacterium]